MVRPCLVPRCPEYAMPGRSYCATHARMRWALGLTGQRSGSRSPSAKVRRAVFERQLGLCACGAICTDLHHVDGDAANNSIGNLIGKCHDCHLTEHGARRRVRRR